MASLTFVAINTRKIIRYSIYAVLLLTTGRILLGFGITVYRTFFPKPPPPPTVAFGTLPKLPFPEKKDLPKFTYKVETPNGALPKFPTQGKVFFMPKANTTLFSLEQAKIRASGLGFDSNGQETSATIYKFSHPLFPSTLEMNIVTGTFSISYNLANDPLPLDKQPPNPEIAASSARGILNAAGITLEDLGGPTSHEFLKVDSQGLSTALSLSEANLIKINLFRKEYEKLNAKTPDPNTSNVWFILSGETNKGRQIIASEYHYFPLDEKQAATYPTKDAQAALSELQNGGGYIASLGQNQDGNVVIRRIYLAYYDAGVYTEFYQPIVVFEGDRNFVAYVPAIQTDYYGQ